MKSDLSLTFGHASKQTPHVIHLESSYAHSRFFSGIRGPGPKSCVPSIGIQALICLSASNITSRSTIRSDRKSTRLNSSHVAISYAVFCFKKKKGSGDRDGGQARERPVRRCQT